MSGGWLPWRRLMWLWLPAAALCLAVIGAYIWQSSGSLGREALLREQVDDLELSLASLEKIQLDLETDRVGVTSLDAALQHVYESIFGSLDGRLVSGTTSKRNDGTLRGDYRLEVSLARFAELLQAVKGLGRVEQQEVSDQQFRQALEPWAVDVTCTVVLVLYERSRQLPSGTIEIG